jgi:hypothetical protein
LYNATACILLSKNFVFFNQVFYVLSDFCCYTDDQLLQIAGIIADMEWHPLNVTFKNVTCNWDETDPDVVSLIVLVDENSQKELAAFVDRIEKQMIANGTPHFGSQFNHSNLFRRNSITRRMCSF